VPIVELLDFRRMHRDISQKYRWWLDTQLHARFAQPWSCLVVVLIAIPFGAASGRRNIFMGVAGSIIICFVYFILLRFGLALGTGGYLPAWVAAWLPNAVFGITGFWLMLRVR
jgi:lipopolysaccharide export LptBFGC system permease protein LptF